MRQWDYLLHNLFICLTGMLRFADGFLWDKFSWWIRSISSNFLSFILSSWNPPCLRLGFPCKSLDKSSDFMDFINPWIYQIYLSIISFHLHILYLGVNITVAILGYTQSMAALVCWDLQKHFGVWGLNLWISWILG